MSLKLSGLNPLSYMGVEPSQPPQMVVFSFDPTENTLNFNIGSYWLNVGTNQTPQENLWILVSKRDGIATWLELSGAGRVKTLTSNSGGAVSPNAAGNINVVGDGITIVGVGTPGSNTITLSAVATDVVSTLTGNSGGAVSPLAGNINVVGDGVTATVVGVPGTHTLTISVIGGEATDSFHTDNGNAAPAAGVITFNAVSQAGSSVTFSGSGSTVRLNTSDANGNTIIGLTAGNNSITGVANTALGSSAINALTSGSSNVIVGDSSAVLLTTGSNNSVLGTGSLNTLLTGTSNVIVGQGSGNNYNAAQSSNILVGKGIGGNAAASGEIRLGNGVNTGNNSNIFIGNQSGNNTYTIPGNGQNIGMGNLTLENLTTGFYNFCVGTQSGQAITTGFDNVLLGNASGILITTGSQNTGIGIGTFYNSVGATGLVSGTGNVALGQLAGSSWTAAESNNICIGDNGVAGENATTRIGAFAGGSTPQTKCLIQGIRGITTVNNNAVAVLIDSSGQLGTVSSSVRFKENIKDMGSVSKDIYGLRPVVFNYKNRSSEEKSYGLIAEEVHDTFPELVVYDLEGKPETVKYLDLIPMLLNETIKLRKELSDIKNSR